MCVLVDMNVSEASNISLPQALSVGLLLKHLNLLAMNIMAVVSSAHSFNNLLILTQESRPFCSSMVRRSSIAISVISLI